jgi:hypothetical protein
MSAVRFATSAATTSCALRTYFSTTFAAASGRLQSPTGISIGLTDRAAFRFDDEHAERSVVFRSGILNPGKAGPRVAH